jgi:hypothetical protein
MPGLRNYKSRIGLAILLSFLATIFFPVFPRASFAKGEEKQYLIKLTSYEELNRLEDVGNDVQKRFSFSTEKQFGNIFSFTSSLSLTDLKSSLAGSFVYLEATKPVKTEEVILNDPGFTINPNDIDKQWALAKAGFDKAWAKTVGSTKNVVAIVDTGIDTTHEDLLFINFVKGFDFINKQELAAGGLKDSDDNGHGTLVTGVLGAAANNGRGIVGTNWNISIMPIKALDSKGEGDSPTISEALVWAADNGATVINLSLGGMGFGHDTTLANAVAYAFKKDIVIVAAAGNDAATTGGNLDKEPVFPICDDNNENMVIGVAAVDQNDLKPAFSNYGKSCVDVAAPGKRILSAINYDPFTKKPEPNAYAFGSGTSLAVPFVSGQAALIRSLYPYATNEQVRDRIITTTDPIDQFNLSQCQGYSCKGLLGSGRINVPRSLDEKITDLSIQEGDLVKITETGAFYHISGGRKRPVSSFVLNQRFSGVVPKGAFVGDPRLAKYPEGPYATPVDGTLVMLDKDPPFILFPKGLSSALLTKYFYREN